MISLDQIHEARAGAGRVAPGDEKAEWATGRHVIFDQGDNCAAICEKTSNCQLLADILSIEREREANKHRK